MFDRIWLNAHLATMTPDAEAALGVIRDGAIAAKDGRIAWVGPRVELPDTAETVTDCGGAWILPGLVDCHTHLVFGGDRAAEFELRLEGASYEEIAKAGGGILSTVKATREADEASLVASGQPRLEALMAEGVTTVEIKSGYGLDTETEIRMLRAARRLGEANPVSVVTSLLAAHAVPPEFKGRQSDYARYVSEVILPAAKAAGVADAVDVFSDRIAFTVEETRWVFDAARKAGLPVKLHGDQLCDFGGAALSAEYGALSIDHAEYSNPEGLAAMAKAGTVAVLLPGAGYFIREEKKPDIAAMRAAGVAMAVSTDMNPGSCPTRSLLLMMNMACTLYRMTVAEVLLGVTRVAAKALGLRDRGMLAPGLRCDLALYAIQRPAELCYWMGGNPCIGRVVAGQSAEAPR
ncbi:imidazolonepropionase [Acetobacteraceae bacterium H6797]|nr:imidazolonepropionase [Acetobacteraceae bacterium H6797]